MDQIDHSSVNNSDICKNNSIQSNNQDPRFITLEKNLSERKQDFIAKDIHEIPTHLPTEREKEITQLTCQILMPIPEKRQLSFSEDALIRHVYINSADRDGKEEYIQKTVPIKSDSPKPHKTKNPSFQDLSRKELGTVNLDQIEQATIDALKKVAGHFAMSPSPAKWLASELVSILSQDRPPKNIYKLKEQLIAKLIEKNVTQEKIDQATFIQLTSGSPPPVNLAQSKEFLENLNALEEGKWTPGEERLFTLTEIPEDQIHNWKEMLAIFLDNDGVKRVLKHFLVS